MQPEEGRRMRQVSECVFVDLRLDAKLRRRPGRWRKQGRTEVFIESRISVVCFAPHVRGLDVAQLHQRANCRAGMERDLRTLVVQT